MRVMSGCTVKSMEVQPNPCAKVARPFEVRILLEGAATRQVAEAAAQ